MYAKVIGGGVVQFPYTTDDLRRDNPNTSFPAVPSAALYAEFGVVPVVVTGAPEHDTATHIVESAGCAYNAERERWETQWLMRELTADEVAQSESEKAAAIRRERNSMLSASDWTQVLDAPVDQLAWAEYRQALRDMTAQVGFPWNVVWPQEP